jgi:hypothetical protein
LEWLYGQVAVVKHRKSSGTFWGLLRQLYKIEFTWVIPEDERRATDGCELRVRWAHETHSTPDHEWLNLGCSFLEMLIALAERAAFQTEEETQRWFWEFIDNLGFSNFHDKSRFSHNFVTRRVGVVCERLYDHMGNGGLFPLRNPKKDQRRVELWYQLSEYIVQDL